MSESYYHSSVIPAGFLALLSLWLKHIEKGFTDLPTAQLVANDIATIAGIASILWIVYQWRQARKARAVEKALTVDKEKPP